MYKEHTEFYLTEKPKEDNKRKVWEERKIIFRKKPNRPTGMKKAKENGNFVNFKFFSHKKKVFCSVSNFFIIFFLFVIDE